MEAAGVDDFFSDEPVLDEEVDAAGADAELEEELESDEDEDEDDDELESDEDDLGLSELRWVERESLR